MDKAIALLSIIALTTLVSLAGGGFAIYQVATSCMDSAQAANQYVEIVGRMLVLWFAVTLIMFPIVAM